MILLNASFRLDDEILGPFGELDIEYKLIWMLR